jgi:iron complex outermembrane receptor protein
MAAALVLQPRSAQAQSRADDNAVTQADDAFGFSIGRESLGIYSADNARGFSPTSAGNLRIDGLYFAPVVGLTDLVVGSQSVKVGISAQGYPFAAPSGIVDIGLRRPADEAGASLILGTDSYGTVSAEAQGSLPVLPGLSLGLGVKGGRTHFADGTRNWYHSEALVGRWRPVAAVEVVPFWSVFTDIDDNSSPTYVPAGSFLPPKPRPGHFPGPWWNGINRTQFNYGMLASASLGENWLLRAGAFRSIRHLRNGYTYLIDEIDRDGVGRRTMFVYPPANNKGVSGEVRLTHTLTEGPRLHSIHLSLRGRDARREYGGEDAVDLGTSSIFQDIDTPRPEFHFGQQSRDRVAQSLYGLAYDGLWRNVGELSFGVSKTDYRKTTDAPGRELTARASPLLYNATLTLLPLRGVAAYAGYSRGFEENGSPPASAANRSDALPAIITRQVDGGVRIQLTPRMKAIAGIFDLRRPYFGFDQDNRYVQIGTIRSRGLEFSLSGSLTDRLTLVAGGAFLSPRVEASPDALGAIGHRPVGIAGHSFSANVNWDAKSLVTGLSLDAGLSHRGETPGTTDNAVMLPARAQLNVGGRYRFTLGKVRAAARVQVTNIFDNRGFSVGGPGVYYPNAARSGSAYLTFDL